MGYLLVVFCVHAVVFATGHAPVGAVGKTRSDVASSTFGRTEAHSNFDSEYTGDRKQKFLTSVSEKRATDFQSFI